MEPTFQIKYRLEKQANRSQSIMNSGFGETSGENRSTLSSILEKSFKNIFPELKKVDHKIKNLFSLLSKEDFSSTIILKSSFSKSFKSIMRFEGKKYFARNLAIIINVDNDEIISQLNGKNRVILTLDVYSENNSDQRIVYFDLDNIHFINETFKYTNPEIALEISSRDLKLLKTNEVPTTVDMVNSQLLLEIKKSGSIFESDNKLKISEWREHVHTMYNYLDSQRSDSESYHIFFHDDVTIKHDVNTKISIVSKGKTDFPNRMIILNDNDFGMSIPVLLNKPKKVNYFKSIKENQESAMKNLDLTQNEINSLLIKNKKEKEKINNALTKKKEEDNEKDSWIRKKEKFNQSTQKFKADLKKLEEIKNIKIHKKDLIQITKDQLHQIQYVKNQINVIKNKVQKIDNSISKCSTTLSKLESEIYIYKKGK